MPGVIAHLGECRRGGRPAPSRTSPHCTPASRSQPSPCSGTDWPSPWASFSHNCNSVCIIPLPHAAPPIFMFSAALRVGSLALLSPDPRGWAASPPMDRAIPNPNPSPGDSLGTHAFPRHLTLVPLGALCRRCCVTAWFSRLPEAAPSSTGSHMPLLSGEVPPEPANPRSAGAEREPGSLAPSVQMAASFPSVPLALAPGSAENRGGGRGAAPSPSPSPHPPGAVGCHRCPCSFCWHPVTSPQAYGHFSRLDHHHLLHG